MVTSVLENYYNELNLLSFDNNDSVDSLLELFKYDIDRMRNESYLMNINEGAISTIWQKIKEAFKKLVAAVKKIFNTIRDKLKSLKRKAPSSQTNETASKIVNSINSIKQIEENIYTVEKDIENPDFEVVIDMSNKQNNYNRDRDKAKAKDINYDITYGTYTREQALSMLINSKEYKDLKSSLIKKKKEFKELKTKLYDIYEKLNIDPSKFDINKYSHYLDLVSDIVATISTSQGLHNLYNVLPNDAQIDYNYVGGAYEPLFTYFCNQKTISELFPEAHPDEVMDRINTIFNAVQDPNFSGLLEDIFTDCQNNIRTHGDTNGDKINKITIALLSIFFTGSVNNNAFNDYYEGYGSNATFSFVFESILGYKNNLPTHVKIKINKDILINWCDKIINNNDGEFKKFIDKSNSSVDKLKQKIDSMKLDDYLYNESVSNELKIVADAIITFTWMLVGMYSTASKFELYQYNKAIEIVNLFIEQLYSISLKDTISKISKLNAVIKISSDQYRDLKEKYKNLIGTKIKNKDHSNLESYVDNEQILTEYYLNINKLDFDPYPVLYFTESSFLEPFDEGVVGTLVEKVKAIFRKIFEFFKRILNRYLDLLGRIHYVLKDENGKLKYDITALTNINIEKYDIKVHSEFTFDYDKYEKLFDYTTIFADIMKDFVFNIENMAKSDNISIDEKESIEVIDNRIYYALKPVIGLDKKDLDSNLGNAIHKYLKIDNDPDQKLTNKMVSDIHKFVTKEFKEQFQIVMARSQREYEKVCKNIVGYLKLSPTIQEMDDASKKALIAVLKHVTSHFSTYINAVYIIFVNQFNFGMTILKDACIKAKAEMPPKYR